MRDGDTRLIINADDFGSSSTVNRAVAEAFERKLINSASLMVNRPSFLEACVLARTLGVQNRLGVHLNMTTGAPLTMDIKALRAFCDARGQFNGQRQHWICLPRSIRTAIMGEWDAQIRACTEQGIKPTHLDTHHHVHYAWPVCGILIDLARQHGIRAIRVHQNHGRRVNSLKRCYTAVFNRRLVRLGLARSDIFCAAEELLAQPLPGTVPRVELMVHPDLNSARQLMDVWSAAGRPELLVERLRRIGVGQGQ